MNVLFQTEPGEGNWRVHSCALSGRNEFDSYQARWTARWLVREGRAFRARAVKVMAQQVEIVAEYERRGSEVVQTSGPEL